MNAIDKSGYISALKKRYQNSSKAEKQTLLNDFCRMYNYNRKYAIRLLNSQPKPKTRKKSLKRGPKPRYKHPLISKVLKEIWVKTNLPCSKRLKAIIPLWLPHYQDDLPEEIKNALLTISAASIDRMIATMRSKYTKKGLATTKPGALLKKHIPVKTNQWDETQPGFVEVDSVAHCGVSMAGMFVYSINCVDIATQWTEQRAVWGKGEKGVLEAIESIENSLPFVLKGFDCDNGSEFLNWHLVHHFTQRKRPIQFTRARAYHKNDNAHVEEKNWTHIRQYLAINDLTNKNLLVCLMNFFKKNGIYILISLCHHLNLLKNIATVQK